MQAIIQYKTDQIDVLLSPIQFRIMKVLEKHPKGLIMGQNNEKGTLMKLLNKPRTTIFDNLKVLKSLRLVKKVSKNNGRRGRPMTLWKLKPPDNFAKYREAMKKRQENARRIKNHD